MEYSEVVTVFPCMITPFPPNLNLGWGWEDRREKNQLMWILVDIMLWEYSFDATANVCVY